MEDEWFKGTIVEKKIPSFTPENVQGITGLHYYIGDNEYYEPVSFVVITFLVDAKEGVFHLKIKFNDVSSLKADGLGHHENQLTGFAVRNVKSRGFERNLKYVVEDYEENLIHFYCAGLEIVSMEETKGEAHQ